MASKSTDNHGESEGKRLSKKRKNIEVNDEDSTSSSEGSEPEQSSDFEDEDEIGTEEINVDFEGQDITKEDFYGIKMLLQQLLLSISMNISELTDAIIAQSDVGSTLKVVDDDEGTVYGITTIVDMQKCKEKECIKKLCKSLKDKCKESSPENLEKISKCLEASSCFLINERFINIPSSVAAPMFDALSCEVQAAEEKGNLNKFNYVMLVAKSVKPTDLSSHDDSNAASSASKKKRKKKLKRKDESENKLEFINQEDELFYKNSFCSFNYCVTKETGFAVSGTWEFGDVAMDTYRTVVFVEYAKLKKIVDEIKKMYS